MVAVVLRKHPSNPFRIPGVSRYSEALTKRVQPNSLSTGSPGLYPLYQRCTGGPPVAPPLDLSPATSARCRASLCSAMQRPGSLSVASQDSEAIKSTSFLILPSPLATNGPFRLNNKPGLTFFCCHFVADFFSSPCCCISRHRRKTAPIF